MGGRGMKTYEFHFSNGLIERVQHEAEDLRALRAYIKSILLYEKGFTSDLKKGKILNLNQLVSVRELEEWETYDNNTP